jgi:hypothetical protein
MVNQAVHLSGVGKLVATSIQWMTAVEGCEGKSVLYDGCGANYRTLVSCSPHGSVWHACMYIGTVNCYTFTFTITLSI